MSNSMSFYKGYKQKIKQRDWEGKFIQDLEFSAITDEEGICLYIYEEGDEPFEPDSKSVIKVPIIEIIKGAIDWDEADFCNKHNAYQKAINSLKHISNHLELELKDNIEGEATLAKRKVKPNA